MSIESPHFARTFTTRQKIYNLNNKMNEHEESIEKIIIEFNKTSEIKIDDIKIDAQERRCLIACPIQIYEEKIHTCKS